MTDIFNNLSNDYINPDLAPCAGEADDATFEFLSGEQIGVVSGNRIISALGLSDIEQSIDGYIQQSKILQSGEITYITGMTKGLEEEVQYFPLDGSVRYLDASHAYALSINASINYYRNFRYYQDAFFATGNAATGVTIENAIDIALGAKSISVDCTYDASGLTFTGETAGYWFDVTAIDACLYLTDTSTWGKTLVEDTSSYIPPFKYPNGAMLGYALKITYPSSTSVYNKYVKINHVPDYLAYYTATEVSIFVDPSSWDASTYYIRDYDEVDVGASGTSCDPDAMTAADYLDQVERNNYWEKVGPLRIWISAEDPADSNTENLITGFYVYNPQSFSVQIDYITII